MKTAAIRLIILASVMSALVIVSCGDAGSEETLTQYFPATKAELKDAVNKEIASRGDRANLNNINTSGVMDMSKLFEDNETFSGDVSSWDVSNVTNMGSMFKNAKKFNGDIKDWDVSNVTDMSSMFAGAEAFTQDLENWGSKIGNVTEWYFSGAAYIFGSSGLQGNEPSWCTVAIGCKP